MSNFILKNWWQLLLILPFAICSLYFLLICSLYFLLSGLIFLWESDKGHKLFVLSLILFLVGCVSLLANAETYKYSNGLIVQAPNYKQAANICFKRLTNGVYPGEERGLDIIDICSNPKKGNIK